MPGFAPLAGPRGGRQASRGKLLGISVSPVHRSIASLLLVLALTSPLLAQQGDDEVVVRAYTFKHQRASEAVPLVYPLLSPRGTVEYQPAGNTLVIRDTQAAIRRIMPMLRKLDHPALPLRLEIFVVRATRNVVSGQVQHSDLPDWLTKRLHDLLAYDNYEMQAQAQLSGAEGQRVVYDLGPEYRVSFRFGTLLEGQRVKLANFRISRQAEGKGEANLLQTNLNLWLDQAMSLGLAKNEASREALMVVLTLREGR
jgi:hypothetical protein